MTDPRVTTPMSQSPLGAMDGAAVRADSQRPLPSPGLASKSVVLGDWPVERPVVRETARRVAAAARREATVHGLAVERVEAGEPSAELVQLLGHLQATLADYVCERRGAGVPVERVLPEVKALVREASALEGWMDPADALMAQVVRWTIKAFYDDPEAAHVRRSY